MNWTRSTQRSISLVMRRWDCGRCVKDRADLDALLKQATSSSPQTSTDAVVFVCGPTGLVEHIATVLRDAGVHNEGDAIGAIRMTTTGPLAAELDMTHVDGNAVIGALSIALGVDMGDVGAVRDNCGLRHAIAECHVYLRCPGIVMSCPHCAAVEIVLVEIAHRFQVTMNGVAALNPDEQPMTELLIIAAVTFSYALVSERLVDVTGDCSDGPHDRGRHRRHRRFRLVRPRVGRRGQASIRLAATALVFFTEQPSPIRCCATAGQLPGRMLGVGLPLTIVAGTALAVVVVLGLSVIEAALLAAVLAPTDAAGGQVVVATGDLGQDPPDDQRRKRIERRDCCAGRDRAARCGRRRSRRWRN